jgi:Flp pilus assembly protein TadG
VSNSKSALYGRRPNRKRGQALVEFALVIPIFMLLLSGIMDFGVMLFQRMTIINSAREGARAAVMVQLPVAPGYIVQTAQGAAVSAAGQAGVTISNSDVNVVCVQTSVSPTSTTLVPGGCNSAVTGDSVKVTVSYSYRTFFPLLFGASFGLGATVQMVID